MLFKPIGGVGFDECNIWEHREGFVPGYDIHHGSGVDWPRIEQIGI